MEVSIPASGWLAAHLIDGTLISVVYFLFLFPFIGMMGKPSATGMPRGFIAYNIFFTIAGTAGTWLYYALMESSSKQGTLGKRALGIIVTDGDGRRLTFGRATGRYFAKILSCLTLYIGFIMAGFTEKKQALHDKIADTLVVSTRPSKGWIIALIAIVLSLIFFLGVVAAIAIPNYLRYRQHLLGH